MKTQVIILEPHDDIISTRDKMTWSKAARILLVFPDKRRILARTLDMVLIQRHAVSLGAQVGLVVRDPVVRENAADESIPVFRSTLEAQQINWRRGRGKVRKEFKHIGHVDLRKERVILHSSPPLWLEHVWVRAMVFLLGVLAVLAMMILVLPTAEVELHPRQEVQSIQLPVMTGKNVKTFNISGRIPWQTLTVTVSGSDHTSTTGSTTIPGEKAVGAVVFTNLTGQTVSIPAGTVVRALDGHGTGFVTLHNGSLLTGNNNSLRMDVEAIQGGSEGNISASSIQTVDGVLGLSVSVTNPEPLQGGTDCKSSSPATTDRKMLRSRLEKTLLDQANARLRNQIQKDDILLVQTMVVSHVGREEYNPGGVEPADQLALALELDVKAQILPADEVRKLAEAVLEAKLPAGMELIGRSLMVDAPETWKTTSDGDLQGILTVHQKSMPQIHAEELAEAIRGQRINQAAQWVENDVALEDQPVFRIKPGWWQRLPFLPFQISILTVQ